MTPDTAFITVMVTAISLFLTIASIFGVRAAWKISQNAQTIKNYREAATSWETYANALKEEQAELNKRIEQTVANYDAELVKAQDTIKTLTLRVQVLEDTVTGKSALTELAATFTTEFRGLKEEVHILADRLRSHQ